MTQFISSCLSRFLRRARSENARKSSAFGRVIPARNAVYATLARVDLIIDTYTSSSSSFARAPYDCNWLVCVIVNVRIEDPPTPCLKLAGFMRSVTRCQVDFDMLALAGTTLELWRSCFAAAAASSHSAPNSQRVSIRHPLARAYDWSTHPCKACLRRFRNGSGARRSCANASARSVA